MLLDDNFEMQGGVRNYLGKTEEVKAPKYWKSSKDSPKTELAYITEAEKGLLLDANLHGSLKDGKPNVGASGLLSYDGWGDKNSDGSSDTSGGNAGAEGGQGSGNSNDSYSGGSNDYTTPTPDSPPGVTNKNFDYETEAYSNVGEIINAIYNPKTKSVDIEQTPGVINTEQYQTSSLGAYLDSSDVNEKDKIKTLNQIQALQNSNIVGSKLSNIETDFVLGNLSKSLDNIKSNSQYSDLISKIDLEGTTVAKDFQDAPLETFVKSGGIIGSIVRSVVDNYRNNKALELLGYTGKTIKYNPDGSGDFNYGGGFLTGNASQGERDAVNQLTPFAADAIGGTTTQPSMVNQYFSNMGSNLGVSSAYMDTYNAAKANIANTLNLQPNNQQYGYGNTFNDTYARSMTSANPFFDELTNQGLI
jgi:hypothetical protein